MKNASMEMKSFKILTIIIVMALAGFILFFRLGEYALWDDEAHAALFAQSLWENGDTYAMLGDNLIAFENGFELQNMHNRYLPPLQFYIAAPFVGTWKNSALAARFPFALFGILTFGMIFFWLNKAKASKKFWIILSIGLLGSVSLFLFFRHCRYYAPTIFFSTLLAYLYTYRSNSWKSCLAIISCAWLLFLSHYLCAVAVFSCFLIDYLIWGRREAPLNKKYLAIMFISILSGCGLFLFKYSNLMQIISTHKEFVSSVKDRVSLFYWNLRDLNTHEFGVGILLLISPAFYFFKKNTLFLRGPVGIIVYCFVLSLFSPQIYSEIHYPIASARYIIPLILLCILLIALCIDTLTKKSMIVATILALLLYGTNIFHGGSRFCSYTRDDPNNSYRSTILAFINELIHPLPEPYRIVSVWMQKNLPKRKSVWVNPGFAVYPLMFHNPQYVYAWQLKNDNQKFGKLDPIHYFQKEYPDYMIAFGPYNDKTDNLIKSLKKEGVVYKKIQQIDSYWENLSKPELYWHSFKEVSSFDKSFQSIYIYQKY